MDPKGVTVSVMATNMKESVGEKKEITVMGRKGRNADKRRQ